jgi:CPA2 family monovalent cation:H+ antiporter-2
VVGYLLAGVAVGPFTPGFVADAQLAPQLAEIGVIFLMFGVGMHFSVRASSSTSPTGALLSITINPFVFGGLLALAPRLAPARKPASRRMAPTPRAGSPRP